MCQLPVCCLCIVFDIVVAFVMGPLVRRFCCHWIHFVKHGFSNVCIDMSASQLGCQFRLAGLTAFGLWHSSEFRLQDCVVDYLDAS